MLVLCCHCNKLPPTYWLKATQHCYLTVQKSETGLTKLKLYCQQDCIPSTNSREESFSFPASTGHPNSLAYWLLLSSKSATANPAFLIMYLPHMLPSSICKDSSDYDGPTRYSRILSRLKVSWLTASISSVTLSPLAK